MVRKTMKRTTHKRSARQHRRSSRQHKRSSRQHRRSSRQHKRSARQHRRSARQHRRTSKRGGFINVLTRSAKQVGHLVSGNKQFMSVESAIYGLKKWANKNDSSGIEMQYLKPTFDNYNSANNNTDKIKYGNMIIDTYNKKGITPYINRIN